MNRSSRRNLLIIGIAAFFVLAVTAGLMAYAAGKDSTTDQDYVGTAFQTPSAANIATNHKNGEVLAANAATKGKTRLIVQVATQVTPNASSNDVTRAVSVARSNVLSTTKGSVTLLAQFEHLPVMVVEADATAVRSLANSSDVVSIMEDIPEKPLLAQSVPLIGGTAAQAAGATGKGWSVAVLDSGVDSKHPFLAGKVIAEACFSTTDADKGSESVCPDGSDGQVGKGAGQPCNHSIDGCDHGTHVAGIAAGNSSTVTGVAKDASIVAVQVFSAFSANCSEGYDYCAISYPSDQIRGMEWVLANHDRYHIAAINMSLGGGKYTTAAACDAANGPRKAAIDSLIEAGVAVVIASGNESYTDGVGTPGCISTAITVGATSKTDAVGDFSNSSDMVDLLAPGVAIKSSIPGNGWATWNGTSMATPHVAGAIAALRSAKPDASVAQILDSVKRTGRSITDQRNGLAKPRIQVDKALIALKGGNTAPAPKPTQPAPKPAPKNAVPNDDVNNATEITGTYFKDTLNTRLATLGDDPVIQPTAWCDEAGQYDHTVWYSFTAPSNGYVQFTTEGSNYDTVMAVFQGSRGAPEQFGCDDDDAWPNVLTSTMGGYVRAGTTFRIEVAAWDDGGDLIFQAAFRSTDSSSSQATNTLKAVSFDANSLTVSQNPAASPEAAPCKKETCR